MRVVVFDLGPLVGIEHVFLREAVEAEDFPQRSHHGCVAQSVDVYLLVPSITLDTDEEITALEDECRFRGCAHLKEPDCAVLEGIHQGTVSPTRYESYVRLREEAREAGAV